MNAVGLRSLFVTSCLAGFSACSDRDDIVVRDAWIPEAPSNVSVMAAYFVIENNGNIERRLSGARSEGFAEIEIHRTVIDDNRSRMERQNAVALPPRSMVEFAPGGLHLMLIGPLTLLHLGDEIVIRLIIDPGSGRDVLFTVRKPVAE